jgi:isopentenyldiphosphate isomerase
MQTDQCGRTPEKRSSMEILDIVNENGEPTGKTAGRDEVHEKGLPHRTSHVWLVRRNPESNALELLLQKRSADKDSFPGCYDISSAGHIPAGDGYAESALRELKEELGISAAEEELIFCGQFRSEFRKIFYYGTQGKDGGQSGRPGKEFHNKEISNVYLLRRNTDGKKIVFQKSEIESVLWVNADKCLKMAESKVPDNCMNPEELKAVIRTAEKEHV